MESTIPKSVLAPNRSATVNYSAGCSQNFGLRLPTPLNTNSARLLCSAKTSSRRRKAAVKSRKVIELTAEVQVNGESAEPRRQDTHEAAPETGANASASTPSSAGTARKIRVAWHKEQGKRQEMEDDIVVQEDAFGGFVYAAVFDGHVGRAAVEFLKEELYVECMEHLDAGKLLDAKDLGSAATALEKAFVKTDERLLHWLEEHSQEPDAGSTATAVFARHDRLFVAHLGDSRAVMAQNGGDAEELSEDHRPHGESSMALAEKQRVEEAGGWVSSGRVCGMIAVSRAFGNRRLKNKREQWLFDGIKKGQWTTRFVNKRKTEEAWLSAVPHVYTSELGEDAEFVLIASDGLWDAVRSSEAVRFVHRQLEKHNDVQKACEELVAFALQERKSDDNISAIVLSFI